jgi:transcriptional regulator with XRE-family HTH domain
MSQSILIAFGHTIRKLRIEKGISQEAFANMCDLHRTYISDVELGKRNVSLENIQKMAEALSLSIHDVFSEVEKNESF